MLSLHLVLTIATPCWLGRLGLLYRQASACAECCSTVITGTRKFHRGLSDLLHSEVSYIGWTSINVFSISSESQFIGASRIVLPSTWWTAVFVRLTFPVVSACGQPIGVSWSCHDIVAASWDADRSPYVAAPMVWNSFPDSLRDPTLSIDNFRSTLKTHLFAAQRDK